MLKEAITFPTEGDEAVKTILLGGVFSLFGFLIAPLLLVYGYMVEVYRAGVNGDAEPPTFSDWDDLAIDGLQVIAIVLAYYIVPMGLFFWGVFSSSTGATTTGSMATSTGASTGMMVALAVSGVLFLIVSYLLPAGMANFAKEDNIAAAFAFGTLKDAVLTADYFVGWLMVIAISIPYTVAYMLISLIPLLGMVVGLFLGFYFQMVVVYIMGRSFAKALDIEPDTGGSGSTGAEVPA